MRMDYTYYDSAADKIDELDEKINCLTTKIENLYVLCFLLSMAILLQEVALAWR